MNATSSGGGRVVLKLRNDETVTKFSNNFKADVDAMRTAAGMAAEYRNRARKNIVILTDVLSVIKALPSKSNTGL
jgi:hypothetical protein